MICITLPSILLKILLLLLLRTSHVLPQELLPEVCVAREVTGNVAQCNGYDCVNGECVEITVTQPFPRTIQRCQCDQYWAGKCKITVILWHTALYDDDKNENYTTTTAAADDDNDNHYDDYDDDDDYD